MTLELILGLPATRPSPVLLPLLPGVGAEPLAAAILAGATGTRRLLPAPGSDESAAAVRAWHRDAWWSLSETERRSVTLATGTGAGCLAPLLGDADMVAVIRDPLQAIASADRADVPKPGWLRAFADGDARRASRLLPFANRQARSLLAPWCDADDLPVTIGPPPDAARWRQRLFDDVLPRVRAIAIEDVAPIARALAERLGCRPAAVARVGEVAEELATQERVLRAGRSHTKLLRALNWLDDELYASRTAEAGG